MCIRDRIKGEIIFNNFEDIQKIDELIKE